MRFAFLTTLLGLVALVVAAADPPQQMSFPKCGMTDVISAIAGSGCAMTDAPCLCKAKTFLKMANQKIVKTCKVYEEYKIYMGFINAQCLGQPGYPLELKARTVSSASRSLAPGTWLALAAVTLALIGI